MKRQALFLSLCLIFSTLLTAQTQLFLINKEVHYEKRGYVDVTGKIVIAPQFSYAEEFSSGVAAVSKDGKYGYINEKGETVIPIRFDYAKPFNGDIAVADFPDSSGSHFINKKGEIICAKPWSAEASEGIILIDKKAAMYFVDAKGNKSQEYFFALPFANGLAYAETPTERMFIDKTFKPVMKMEYKASNGFYEGKAAVEYDNKLGYIDKTGKLVIPCQYPFSTSERKHYFFQEGLAAFGQYKRNDGTLGYGFIDQSGKTIVPDTNCAVRPFSDGLAAISINKGRWECDNWNYVNNKGEVVIKGNFYQAYDFFNGRALVMTVSGNDYFYSIIDKKGGVIKKFPAYEGLSADGDLSKGLCRIFIKAEDPTSSDTLLAAYGGAFEALVDRDGKIVWKSKAFYVCFPPHTGIAMADGSTKPIMDVEEGDIVLAADPASIILAPTTVTGKSIHNGQYRLMSIKFRSGTGEATAATENIAAFSELIATPNHPVLTSTGVKPVDQILPGDIIYFAENQIDLKPIVVESISDVATPVTSVYSLQTQAGTFIASGVVVMMK
ncbi:MAG: WG repeat-containing protein [Bacteroidetes bacterium]|nr:WG repeat-containing protein [Bacteroidota bacterium]MBU1717652.1 WG repeat-containing protein [Bacteroidota bacterium]